MFALTSVCVARSKRKPSTTAAMSLGSSNPGARIHQSGMALDPTLQRSDRVVRSGKDERLRVVNGSASHVLSDPAGGSRNGFARHDPVQAEERVASQHLQKLIVTQRGRERYRSYSGRDLESELSLELFETPAVCLELTPRHLQDSELWTVDPDALPICVNDELTFDRRSLDDEGCWTHGMVPRRQGRAAARLPAAR